MVDALPSKHNYKSSRNPRIVLFISSSEAEMVSLNSMIFIIPLGNPKVFP